MVLSKIHLGSPLIKSPLLQGSFCLNTKIVKDKDVEVSGITVKVSDVDVDGAMKFIEARLPLRVDAAHPSLVLTVTPCANRFGHGDQKRHGN